MKQGTLITKIIMFILFAAVVVYLAIYAVQGFSDPFSTAIAYQDVLNDSVEVTGLVVRQEQPLSDSAAIMDVLPEEGERVAAGETVAVLYQSSEALERQKQLQSMKLEREQLRSALTSGSSLSDAAKLEQDILNAISQLHAGTSGGELSALESDALSLRTLILQREFAYSASGDSAAALKESIAELDEQIAQLEAQSSGGSTSVRAPCSGLFSCVSDGLEGVLTPEALETVTADELSGLIKQADSAAANSVGKLITGTKWYFVTTADAETADRLQPGGSIIAAFSRTFTGQVRMQVERIGPEEKGGCVLVLSCDRNLRDVTLLRGQTVELIFTQYTGIRVPKQALRLETVEFTDPDTGEKRQSQALGLYAVAGAQAEFKPVDIVREGSDYYLVTSAKESDFFRTVSTAEASKRVLRAGDEIIVTASELYDGKVVLE